MLLHWNNVWSLSVAISIVRDNKDAHGFIGNCEMLWSKASVVTLCLRVFPPKIKTKGSPKILFFIIKRIFFQGMYFVMKLLSLQAGSRVCLSAVFRTKHKKAYTFANIRLYARACALLYMYMYINNDLMFCQYYWKLSAMKNITVADCINIGYFIQWIRDNQWITLSNLVMLSNLDNPLALYKTILGYLTFWMR